MIPQIRSIVKQCRGMTNNQMKNAISAYAEYDSNYSASETMAGAVCDYSINSEDAAPLSKEILIKRDVNFTITEITENESANKIYVRMVMNVE